MSTYKAEFTKTMAMILWFLIGYVFWTDLRWGVQILGALLWIVLIIALLGIILGSVNRA